MKTEQVKSLQEEIEKEAENRHGNEDAFYNANARLLFIEGATWMSQFQRQEWEGWVKVEDRLPEEKSIHRILTFGWDNEYVAYYEGKQFYCLDQADESGNLIDITSSITYWKYLKLPSPPETK